MLQKPVDVCIQSPHGGRQILAGAWTLFTPKARLRSMYCFYMPQDLDLDIKPAYFAFSGCTKTRGEAGGDHVMLSCTT